VCHTSYRSVDVVLISLPRPLSPQLDIPQSLWCQTYSYLPSHKTLPLPLGQYSLPVPLREAVWVGLSGWLHNKMAYPRKVTHLSCNQAPGIAPFLTWPTTLTLGQIATRFMQELCNRTRNNEGQFTLINIITHQLKFILMATFQFKLLSQFLEFFPPPGQKSEENWRQRADVKGATSLPSGIQ